MEKIIKVRSLQRTDTYENWNSINPVLKAGEIAYDETNNKFKIGDGVHNFNSLEYVKGVGQEYKSGTNTGEIFNDLDKNIASGNYSHSQGYNTAAKGDYSHASGYYTEADGEAQTVIGKYNVVDETSSFIIGNGTSDSNRSNAMTVDSSGNAVFSGTIKVNTSEDIITSADLDDKADVSDVGNISNLITLNKANLVNAINEIKTNIKILTEPDGTTTTSWTHPRGNEISSARDPIQYNSINGIIMYEKMQDGITFNRIKFPIFLRDTTNVDSMNFEFRVYVFDTFPGKSYYVFYNFPQYLKATVNIPGNKMNTVMYETQAINLESPITVNPGETILIGVALTSGTFGVIGSNYYYTQTSGITNPSAADSPSSGVINVSTLTSPHHISLRCETANVNPWESTWVWQQGGSASTTFELEMSYEAAKDVLSWIALIGTIPSYKIGNSTIDPIKLKSGCNQNISLPTTLYATKNSPTRLYYENLIGNGLHSHYMESYSNILTEYSSDAYYQFTSSDDTNSGTIINYDNNLAEINRKDFNIISTDSAYTSAINALFIGDDIFSSSKGLITSTMGENSNISTKVESYQGAKLSELCESATIGTNSDVNPFYYESAFDFGHYIESTSSSTPNIVLLHFGPYDLFNSATITDSNSVSVSNINYFNTVINSIKSYNQNSLIAILLPIFPPAESLFQSFSEADGSGGFVRWKYKRNIHNYVCNIINSFDNKQSDNVFVAPFGMYLDAENDYSSVISTDIASSIYPNSLGIAKLNKVIEATILGIAKTKNI